MQPLVAINLGFPLLDDMKMTPSSTLAFEICGMEILSSHNEMRWLEAGVLASALTD